MPSRQDQLHSYQFMVQRVVAALLLRDSDPVRSPLARPAGAALASLLVAAIALGAVSVYGAVTGGTTRWRDPAAVIVEKESGARYVYRDEKLHPVLNYASALLIAGSTTPRTLLVPAASMEDVPRGVPLGIPGAPDSLPAAGRLTTTAWTVCSLPASVGDRRAARSVLLVSGTAAGGRSPDDAGVLARHPDGSIHLIWHRRRYLIREPELVLAALGWAAARPAPVAPALLNVLPAGADLARMPIAGHGRPSPGVPGARIGEVFAMVSLGGDRQYLVAERDGLAAVTQVQAAVLLAQSGQDEPTELSRGRFVGIRRLPDLVPEGPAAPPASPPELVDATTGAICGQVRDDSGVSQLRIAASVPDGGAVPRTAARTATGGALADQVVVPPGRGVLVEAAAAPGAGGGTVCLVVDLGRRHPVPSSDVLGMLGYGKVATLRLPASLVALIPPGPALDPAAARTPADPSARVATLSTG